MNKESSALPLKGGEVDGIRVTNEIFQRLQWFGEVCIKKVDPRLREDDKIVHSQAWSLRFNEQ